MHAESAVPKTATSRTGLRACLEYRTPLRLKRVSDSSSGPCTGRPSFENRPPTSVPDAILLGMVKAAGLA